MILSGLVDLVSTLSLALRLVEGGSRVNLSSLWKLTPWPHWTYPWMTTWPLMQICMLAWPPPPSVRKEAEKIHKVSTKKPSQYHTDKGCIMTSGKSGYYVYQIKIMGRGNLVDFGQSAIDYPRGSIAVTTISVVTYCFFNISQYLELVRTVHFTPLTSLLMWTQCTRTQTSSSRLSTRWACVQSRTIFLTVHKCL